MKSVTKWRTPHWRELWMATRSTVGFGQQSAKKEKERLKSSYCKCKTLDTAHKTWPGQWASTFPLGNNEMTTNPSLCHSLCCTKSRAASLALPTVLGHRPCKTVQTCSFCSGVIRLLPRQVNNTLLVPCKAENVTVSYLKYYLVDSWYLKNWIQPR